MVVGACCCESKAVIGKNPYVFTKRLKLRWGDGNAVTVSDYITNMACKSFLKQHWGVSRNDTKCVYFS